MPSEKSSPGETDRFAGSIIAILSALGSGLQAAAPAVVGGAVAVLFGVFGCGVFVVCLFFAGCAFVFVFDGFAVFEGFEEELVGG
jgi:hypothetical protein